ncbi:MAG: DNA polymerase III subunit beta [Bacteroidales bacterium]|nr:DNA polymerase III subunit beta [Bacteroidales bacterium]
MNFVVSSSELLKHLQLVGKVINSKNTLPILDNYLFVLENNELVITASDLETTLSTKILPESSEGNGSIAIEAKRLNDILKEFPEQPLRFEINQSNRKIDLRSDRGVFTIMGQNPEDFPQFPTLDESRLFTATMNSEVLFAGINKTLFATADDELRPVMNGIFIEISTSDITFVASDSHKLVRYRRKDFTSETESSFILPKKPAMLLKNLLNRDSNNVQIQYDAKNAYFLMTDYKMVCRLVEGRYPAYNSVIPVNNPYKMIVDRVDFLTSLKRVNVFSNQASNLVKLSVNPDKLEVSAQDIDYSISAIETIPCQFDGNSIDIGFKSVFLIEILNNLSTPDIILEMTDPSRAGILLPFNHETENDDTLMLIMPMMLSN